jgi:predicted AAA+ superfamily ATPase
LSTIEEYLRVYLNSDFDGLLMIDEFQYIDGVSVILKLLADRHNKLKILCTGSSSLDILQHVEESMAGRMRIIEVLSLSFAEYLTFKNGKLYDLQQSIEDMGNPSLTEPLQQVYQEYLIYGGLPRAALTDNQREKAEVLNDIYQTYLMNDVRHYISNAHFVGFNRLLRLLAAQIGNLVNINELSRESGLSYTDCEKYLHLLQHMYIIKLVEPFFTNKRKVIGKMKKVYFCDLGLRNIIYSSFNDMAFRTDNGAIFENEVFLELWRSRQASETIQFYRTQNGTEVDFVIDGPFSRKAVECKYKRFNKLTSIASLNSFCNDEGINHRYVANINAAGTLGDLRFIPGIFTDRIGKQ